ncbi:MAG: coenzyme F420-0:L-glutamate ligase [Candidatus Dormibacteria bacterium]
MNLHLFGVEGIPEIRPGDDLGALVAGCAAPLCSGDIIVVAQKVVSKAEGRLRDLSAVTVGRPARRLARRLHADPRMVQVILDESVRIVRDCHVLIVETRHGFVCANAGVDRSNVPGDDLVSLLPIDCDASADMLRSRIAQISGMTVGVIVSDTWGRPWRLGITNFALGVSGMPALLDYRGRTDDFGMQLNASLLATADELAAAAELVMGKTGRVPAVVIRGFDSFGDQTGRGSDLIRPRDLDLFR